MQQTIMNEESPKSQRHLTTEDELKDDNDGGRSDDDFREWIHEEMTAMSPQVQELYPELFSKCADAVTNWRKRFHGNIPLWRRLFKHDRVLKEVIESVPVIDAVEDWMKRRNSDGLEKITIIDLCSGKGYLSMLLSEILPPHCVEKCLLIDKAWPLCHSIPQSHHMSWEHIYGNIQDDNGPHYFNTWPIPLVTCKKNLKQSRELKELQHRFSNPSTGQSQGPVLILAVHLCGTLSIQAVKLFQNLPTAQMLLLKPCCLPDIWHAKNTPVFQVGNYCFPTKDVCARGKWTTDKNNRWEGPPRWHLHGKFDKWCHYLHEAMSYENQTGLPVETDADEKIGRDTVYILETRRFEVPLQTKGGFQNSFLVAERRER